MNMQTPFDMKELRQLLCALLLTVAGGTAQAQAGLSVTVHCDQGGTLFVKIQEKIEEIGELADITSLTVSGTLNRDDYNVIRNQMTNLASLNLAGTDNEAMKTMYLAGKKRLKTIVFSSVATDIASQALNGCDSLQNFTLPPTVTTIGSNAFQNCKSLTSITLPSGMTAIGNAVFADCTNLSQVQLPPAITTIGSWAFSGTALTAVTIPATVTKIEDSAYRSCQRLTSITFQGTGVTLRGNVFRNTGLTSYTLPPGVVIDGDATFGDCPNLKSFTFADGLTDEKMVGTSTFWHCYALEQVRLPADLTVIPKYFFSGTPLTTVNFPSTVTRIDDEAFAGMTAWRHPVIPGSVQTIGNHLFWSAKIEEIDWPAQLHIIPYETFRDCQQLVRVGIPSTVDSIGNGAFSYCSALPSIHLPEGIRTLNATFYQCTSLAEANIPSTVTYLASGSFSNCKALSHIDIPDGVTYIGPGCFENCPLTEVRLPSALRQMGGYAFNGGQYERMVVPEGVISIGTRAFRSDNLRVLDLPSTLLSVGGCMLGDNSQHHPDSVILRAMVPPYSYNEFLISRDRPTTLYVPQASIELYLANADYNQIENIKPLDIGQSHLNIIGKVAITPTSGLQQGKYDVDMITLHDIAGIEQSSDHHPSLTVSPGATMRIGRLNMTFDANTAWSYRQTRYDCFVNHGTTTIDDIDLRCLFTAKYFFTPPFDVRVSDIIGDNPNTPITFYRYNGAARASTDFEHTWVRILPGETLHPGTAYAVLPEPQLYQDNTGRWSYHTGYYHLKPLAGGTNHFTTSSDVSVPLQHHASEFPHNRNWNLVGMPFPAFLDIRGMDYDGPVFILNTSSAHLWKAVSALDDEIVLYPHEAMFIQCPDGVSAVTFSADRRQVDGTFVKGSTQNSRLALRRADQNRQRVRYDATLLRHREQGDSLSAHTRFVINPAATTGYDIGRDAPLMAIDGDNEPAMQLYTHSQGLAYAINERPLSDGIVHLGMQLAEEGTYTLRLSVKGSTAAGGFPADTPVWLIDNEEHTRTLLTPASGETEGATYTFTATAGSHPQRFTIALGDAEPTAIESVEAPSPQPSPLFFNLLGQPVSPSAKGVYIKDGKKIVR